MIRFDTILDSACAAVDVAANDKDSALEAAVAVLVRSGKIQDAELLLEEIRTREKLASTGIGEGVAVPHALCDLMTETVMAAVRLKKAVDFDAPDARPVDLLFIMAGPRGETALHLKLLSKLARLLHDEEFRKAARTAKDAQALAALLYSKD